MTTRLLTVEIHDVTPAYRAEIVAIQRALEQIGVARTTLLVVPAFEDQQGRAWDLRAFPEFVEWMKSEQQRGSEIILHGLTHRAPCPPPSGLKNWMMHHVYSRGCAEFAHLDRSEARARLNCGREILEECGLSAQGFIAPAWQQSPAAIEEVAAAGFMFTAFFRHVVKIADEHECVAPVLTFAASGAWSDHGKRLYMRAVEASAVESSLLRVALHPEDVNGPLAHAVERIRVLLENREQVTYAEWLALPEEPA